MATATRRRAAPPWWRRRRWYRSELPGERRTGVRNEYAGFRLRSAGRLRAVSAQLGARRFFDQYVATRTPVLVRGLLPELIEPSRRWLDGGLRRAAGQSRVRVELRGSSAEAFGRGNRVEMPFAELLRRLGRGDTSHYMTTQPLPALANGSEATVGPPLDKVQHEIPSRPSLLPSLQLQSVNLWVGCAAGGITAPGATGAGLAGPIAAVGSPSECSGEAGGAAGAGTGAGAAGCSKPHSGYFGCRVSARPPAHARAEIVWPVSGSTGGGASSGLHHDHHDNLLCLLRGTKVGLYLGAGRRVVRWLGRSWVFWGRKMAEFRSCCAGPRWRSLLEVPRGRAGKWQVGGGREESGRNRPSGDVERAGAVSGRGGAARALLSS